MGILGPTGSYLISHSSGNNSLRIDSAQDTPECLIKGNHLMVGSFNAAGDISPFSNHGACVDFYTLGSKVITATVGDVLLPLDGTSFSAPLAVRYMTSFKETSPKEIKEKIASILDSKRFFKMDSKHTRSISYESGPGLPLFGDEIKTDFFGEKWQKDQIFREAAALLQRGHL